LKEAFIIQAICESTTADEENKKQASRLIDNYAYG